MDMNQYLNKLVNGNNLKITSTWPSNYFDSIITDPPYELGFMGKSWDSSGIAYSVPLWKQLLRVSKPGAFLLCFGGTRTYHRVTCAIEDAGWEIRDCMMWLYGSGFPKSHNISKAIQKAKGIKPDKIEPASGVGFMKPNSEDWNVTKHKLTMPEPEGLAKQWDGYGTALKPAWEPIIVAMKPLDGTFAHNAEKHAVAGLNIDGGRIGTEIRVNRPAGNKSGGNSLNMSVVGMPQDANYTVSQGRWPANLLLSCDCQNNDLTGNAFYGIIQETIKETEICQSKNLHSSASNAEERKTQSDMTSETKNLFSVIEHVKISILEKILGKLLEDINKGNAGCSEEMLMGSINTSLNMFISGKEQTEKFQTVMKYIISMALEQIIDSKISNVSQFQAIEVFITKIISGIRKERRVVLHNKDCPVKMLGEPARFFYAAKAPKKERNLGCEDKNNHPTVKPLTLLKYLCTLLKMPSASQVILDPFMGSGTTGMACKSLGINFIGIDLSLDYCHIARKRIDAIPAEEK